MSRRGWPVVLAALLASSCGQSTAKGPAAPGQSSGSSAGGSGQGTGTSTGPFVDGGDDGGPVANADASEASPEATIATICSPPGTLCWGFEEGTIPPGWTRYRMGDGFPGQLLVDSTRPHQGSYALHAKDYQGGSPDQQGGPKYTITYTLPAGFGPVLWGRAYVYTSPAAPPSHAGFFNARYPRPGTQATLMAALDWYEVATDSPTGMDAGNYMAIWHVPEPPGQPEDVRISDTTAVAGDWACIEWLFDGSGGDAGDAGVAAEPRMWLNGAELSWPTVFTYPTIAAAPVREIASNFIELETGVYMYQGLTAVTNWWIDDLAVGPQRIGCN